MKSVAISDLNGDARPDLAVGDGPGIAVRLGDGTGSFGAGRRRKFPERNRHV